MGHRIVSLRRASFTVVSIVGVLIGFANSASAAGSYDWIEQTSAGAQAWQHVAASADGEILAASVYGGNIWTSSDAGATWIERTGAGSRNWRPIAASTDGMRIAAGAWTGSNIWTSSDAGATWIERTTSGSRNWGSIATSDDGTRIAAATNNGSVWTSSDSGATWTERTGAGIVRHIRSSSDGTKLAAIGYGGSVWTSSDSGATWTEREPHAGLTSWHGLASSSDGTKLVIVENGGSVWTSSDSGATWTERTGAGSRKWETVAMSANGSVIAAADTGGINTITISTDAGATWTTQNDPGSHIWQHLGMNADGSRITATYISGGIWTAYSPPDPIEDPLERTTTVRLLNAVNTNPVSITTAEGTDIACSTAHTEDGMIKQDPGYIYPSGLVRFCFTTPDANNEVSVTFVTDMKPEEVTVRHFNAVTSTYTTIPHVVLSQTSLDGRAALRATYTVTDNGPLDENSDLGSITDPVGLAKVIGAPNTGIGSVDQQPPSHILRDIVIGSILGYCIYWARARQRSSLRKIL